MRSSTVRRVPGGWGGDGRPVTIARRHLATLAELANRAVANPPHHAEEVEALDAAARALGVGESAGSPAVSFSRSVGRLALA